MAQAQNTDLAILNYALTLEHLETEMYKQAIASGKLTGKLLNYARAFGAHEAAHVEALTATIRQLGGTPVAARSRYNFPAFDTADNIMKFISTIEDTGVGAYLGQVGRIQNKTILGAAAGIYAVEALHTAAIRTAMGREANPNGAFEKALTMEQVLAAAGSLLGPEAMVTGAPMPGTMPRTGEGADSVLSLVAAGAGLAAVGVGVRHWLKREDA